MKYDEVRRIVRRLRNNQTKSEKLLWEYIRNRQLDGRKFLRQHPIIYNSNRTDIFFFVADYYCAQEKLVIELDRKVHDYQKEHDKWRDKIIEAQGLRVLRIKNKELDDVIGVLERIRGCFGS